MLYLRFNKDRGVSIIELLVSVAILAILVGLGIPNLRLFREKARIKESANTLLSDIHFARMKSMETGLVTVTFNSQEKNYSIALWDDSNGNDEIENSELTVVKTVQLPKGIEFGVNDGVDHPACSNNDEGYLPDDGISFEYENGDNVLVFNKRGYPISKDGNPGGEVYIHNDRATYAISVKPGGLIKKCSWDGENWHE